MKSRPATTCATNTLAPLSAADARMASGGASDLTPVAFDGGNGWLDNFGSPFDYTSLDGDTIDVGGNGSDGALYDGFGPSLDDGHTVDGAGFVGPVTPDGPPHDDAPVVPPLELSQGDDTGHATDVVVTDANEHVADGGTDDAHVADDNPHDTDDPQLANDTHHGSADPHHSEDDHARSPDHASDVPSADGAPSDAESTNHGTNADHAPNGNTVIVFDDGSTMTTDPAGNVVAFTESHDHGSSSGASLVEASDPARGATYDVVLSNEGTPMTIVVEPGSHEDNVDLHVLEDALAPHGPQPGENVIVFDDGSTLITDAAGNVVGFTEAHAHEDAGAASLGDCYIISTLTDPVPMDLLDTSLEPTIRDAGGGAYDVVLTTAPGELIVVDTSGAHGNVGVADAYGHLTIQDEHGNVIATDSSSIDQPSILDCFVEGQASSTWGLTSPHAYSTTDPPIDWEPSVAPGLSSEAPSDASSGFDGVPDYMD